MEKKLTYSYISETLVFFFLFFFFCPKLLLAMTIVKLLRKEFPWHSGHRQQSVSVLTHVCQKIKF